MKIVYAIVMSSGSYDSYNTMYLRAYSTREAALELIKALAAEMIQFEAEYKKTKPGAKFGVSYNLRDDFVQLSATEMSSWGGPWGRLPGLSAMCEHIASTQIGKEFHPELWSQDDPFDGDFSLSIEALPFFE